MVTARIARGTAPALTPGDIGRWKFGATLPRVRPGNRFETHACDDLAAVAAALSALDVLHRRRGFEHVGILFTRAEEIGFVGAIGACKARSVPKKTRLICLENSRSFADSPIGSGPIVRVGDRLSVFEPNLTNRLGAIMLAHAETDPTFRWQRKLMPGGACEATAFSTYGYESTCVCLPLGNYHNMRDIDGVLAGRRPAKVGPEFISIDDYHGLVELLVLCCGRLDDDTLPPLIDRMERLWTERRFVL
jgi:endoglucanase